MMLDSRKKHKMLIIQASRYHLIGFERHRIATQPMSGIRVRPKSLCPGQNSVSESKFFFFQLGCAAQFTTADKRETGGLDACIQQRGIFSDGFDLLVKSGGG
jgi:hypothetical protein